MNIFLKITLALSSTMIIAMANAQTTLLAEITQKKYSESKSKVDITREVQKYIAVGSPAEAAKEILLANGFVVTNHRANAKNFLLGKREIGQSILGFREANVSLKITDSKVEIISGSIFWHTF